MQISKDKRNQRRNGFVGFLQHGLFGAAIAAVLLHSVLLACQTGGDSFEKWAARASAARQAGDPTAIEDYQHAVALKPSWEEGWFYLGTMNYDREQFADAQKAFEKVVALDSKQGAALGFLGLCEFETRNYKASFIHLQRAQTLGFAGDSQLAKVAGYHLALLLNLNGEFEKSTALLVSQFGSAAFPDQLKIALGLALLRIPLLPNQVDPAHDALIQAAGGAATALVDHKIDAAQELLHQMLAQYPDTPYLHYAYGVSLVSASRYREAETEFRQEAMVTPSEPFAWLGLTAALLRQGHNKEAETAARHALKLAPRSADSYFALTRVLEAEGQKNAADEAKNKAAALAKAPPPVEVAQQKRYSAASGQDAVKLSTPAESSPDFESLARRAEMAQATGKLAEAGNLYRAALELRPEWGKGWRMVGTFAYMDGQFADAVVALKRSVEYDAKPPETWTVLGLAEFETQDYKNALIHLRRGSEGGFGGNSAAIEVAKYHLAALLNLDGKFDEALNLLIPVVGAAPPTENLQFVMGISLLRLPKLPSQIASQDQEMVRQAGRAAALLSESRYDQAFVIFDELLKENPKTPFLHLAYGSALASSANYDRAREQLQAESQVNPSSAIAYVRLATISLTLHQPEEALKSSKEAVALAPDDAESQYVLGRSLLEMGDAPAAVEALETSRRLAPGSPEIHFNLARAYAKVHRQEEAARERAEFERLQAQTQRNSPDIMGSRLPAPHDAISGQSPTKSPE